jgi:hypothetical protein
VNPADTSPPRCVLHVEAASRQSQRPDRRLTAPAQPRATFGVLVPPSSPTGPSAIGPRRTGQSKIPRRLSPHWRTLILPREFL